jgi:multidrug efflux pump subunit AcrB
VSGRFVATVATTGLVAFRFRSLGLTVLMGILASWIASLLVRGAVAAVFRRDRREDRRYGAPVASRTTPASTVMPSARVFASAPV